MCSHSFLFFTFLNASDHCIATRGAAKINLYQDNTRLHPYQFSYVYDLFVETASFNVFNLLLRKPPFYQTYFLKPPRLTVYN